jgi:hypothetical protein
MRLTILAVAQFKEFKALVGVIANPLTIIDYPGMRIN